MKTAKNQSSEGTIKNPVIELVNAPKVGATFPSGMLEGLLEIARLNKAKRLIVVFER